VTPSPRARALAEALRRRLPGEVEVFEKRGRSRRYERGATGESVELAEEQGWAVRAGDLARSGFVAGSGELPERLDPFPATAHPLALPAPRAAAPFQPARELDEPLASESEAWALLDGIEREIARERPGARLAAARLEEGSSESALVSTRGIEAGVRMRAATLRLEVEQDGDLCLLERIERSLRGVKPLAVARRAVDRLHARRGGGPLAPAAELVVAAPLAARLVEALAPLLAGAGAVERLAPLADAEGRIGARPWRLIDDGRHPAGVLAVPFDGEGVPTGETVLLEEGRLVRSLLARWEAPGLELPGCARRASWRDLPRRAPTQLFLPPEPAVAASDLVESVRSGAYLIEAEGGLTWEPATLRFRVPASGYRLERGRAAGALGVVELHGELGALFTGLAGVARDLSFVAGDGLFGAPTLLFAGRDGLGLRASARARE